MFSSTGTFMPGFLSNFATTQPFNTTNNLNHNPLNMSQQTLYPLRPDSSSCYQHEVNDLKKELRKKD
jgi:hypothetical protein